VVNQNNCLCASGNLVVDPDGTTTGVADKVGFLYTTATGVAFARSVNGGLTWTQAVVDPTGGGSTMESHPMVADAGGGALVAVWLEVTWSAAWVRFSRSSNWGLTWSAPVVIVGTGTSTYPSVAASGSKVAVSLYRTTSTGTPGTVPASATWMLSYLDSFDGGSTFSALQVADPTAVKVGPVCAGISCTSGTELGTLHGIALDAAGKANIAYARSTGTTTEIRYVREL
jgi:hypothetical protein